MTIATDATLACALEKYLAAQLRPRAAARAFFRVSGFSTNTYAALLDRFAKQAWKIEGRALEVRSIEPIAEHHDRVMAPNRTATWYRNHLSPGQALVLIQNRLSADAQSLQDIFPVTEVSLVRDGLPQLIEAAVVRYQLNTRDRDVLVTFVHRLAQVRFEPQLRDLAEFLMAVDTALDRYSGTPIERAIAQSLPNLDLFRCLDLADVLNTAPGDKLLSQLASASSIGRKILDERTRADYLGRLEHAELANELDNGGATAEQKREIIRRFLEGELQESPEQMLQVLQIDWREIQLVMTPRKKTTRQERFIRLTEALETALDGVAARDSELRTVMNDLREGVEPEGEQIDRMLREHGDSLAPTIRNDLRRLVKIRTRKHADLLVGLTALAVELLQPLQSPPQPDLRLHVISKLDQRANKKVLYDALFVFRTLFGGIERALPTIVWQLDALWERLRALESDEDEDEDEDDPGNDRERVSRLEIPFEVRVVGQDEAEIVRAELIWQYRSDSPAAATALTLAAEHERIEASGTANERRLGIPLFQHCLPGDHIGDLDISRPIQSLGAWFERPDDLRTSLNTALRWRARTPVLQAFDTALTTLETAWARLVDSTMTVGLLNAEIDTLLEAYTNLLSTAAVQLRTPQEAAAGFRVLNQAWIVGPPDFERWALVPLFHPLKLLWWRARARLFDDIVAQLLDATRPVTIVDEMRYRRELTATYGSSGSPPLLALPPGEGRPATRFLPVKEIDGYELYIRETEHNEPYGLDSTMLADDEAEIVGRDVEGIAAVIKDYIETYPFVRNGLEIVIFECRNGALPGLLIDQLAKISAHRGWQVRLSVTVHTSDRGAPLFQRASAWVEAQHAANDRNHGGFFPPIELKVIQCSVDELLATRGDNDIVILADVLSDRSQHVDMEIRPPAPPDVPIKDYLPMFRAQQEPFQQGDNFRRLKLSQIRQPTLVRLFGLMQHAVLKHRPMDVAASVNVYRDITLHQWEHDLGKLHEHFNWVICYDTTIDRFLLRSTLPEKAQVIRYSLGLGAKGQHNLTVSSTQKAQTIVERRLTARLASMLSQLDPRFLMQVTGQLIEHAKQVSGDIVLRAAGPGAFLNELIGLVVSKFLTERRYRAQYPAALTTWILLDDFEHWFDGGKFPDLLFVAISRNADGELLIQFQVAEAKCVTQSSFDVEARDAEEQVRRGVSRLAQAFAPGAKHLDAQYWYDQLYRAAIGNLEVTIEQEPLWQLFRERFCEGKFRAIFEGHIWAFCYDGQVGNTTGPDEDIVSTPAPGAPEVPLLAHRYGRNALCQALRELSEEDGEQAPPEQWLPTKTPPAPLPVPVTIAPIVASPVQAASPTLEPIPITSIAVVGQQMTTSIGAGVPLETRIEPSPTAIDLDESERRWVTDKARDLERALRQRGVQIMPIDPALADVGPSIVRFKFRLRPNESVRKLANVADDLARDLALAHAPIMANVQRTTFVGIDIPRAHPQTIALRPLLDQLGSPAPAELPIIFGIAPNGALIVEDLSEFPHLLVAGATGSGKSVFLRSLLLSLMTQYAPGQLELLVVDPKQTDFSFFDGLPYLRGGTVFTSPPEAREALLELVRVEMPRRQQLIRGRSMKVKDFNRRYPDEALPPIVALIDEYAQLMTLLPKKEGEQFERDLMSLGAVARSVSIHLVLATQRPSADVVTSTLKANLDARVAFRVASNINSRVILDQAGAESLLGKGDMLFRKPSGEIMRLQAPFMDEEEMQAYLATLLARPTHTARS